MIFHKKWVLALLAFFATCSSFANKTKDPKPTVQSVVFSPDNSKILAAYNYNDAKVWSSVDGELLFTLREEDDGINTAQWSPDGKKIITTSDETASIWNASSGKRLFSLKRSKNNSTIFYNAIFSPDGEKILTTSWGNTEMITAEIWNGQTGKLLFTLSGHSGDVVTAIFSPDSQRIFTADNNATAKLWNADTGEHLLSLYGQKYWTPFPFDKPSDDLFFWHHEASFSSDSELIATISDDDVAKVWQAATGKHILTLKGHEDWVYQVLFSADNQTIFTASADGTAKIWDATNGALLQNLVNGAKITAAAFSPDSSKILTMEQHPPKIWDVETGELLFTLNGAGTVNTFAFSPDGKKIVTGQENGFIVVWDAESGAQYYTMR